MFSYGVEQLKVLVTDTFSGERRVYFLKQRVLDRMYVCHALRSVFERTEPFQVLAIDITMKKVNDSDTIFTRLAEENRQTVTLYRVKGPDGCSVNARLKEVRLGSSAAELKKAFKRRYPGGSFNFSISQ